MGNFRHNDSYPHARCRRQEQHSNCRNGLATQKIIWYDTGINKFREKIISDKNFLIGGRALSSLIISRSVPAGTDALGPNNNLTFCYGILAGTTISNANRLSIGGKSPLTVTIKESNSGGTFAYHLGELGIRTLVIEEVQLANIANRKSLQLGC